MNFKEFYIEEDKNIPLIVYRWLTSKQMEQALKINMLKAGNWLRYVEETNKLEKGISFGLDKKRWKQPDLILMKIQTNFPNKKYLMNGEKAYWQTLSITDNTADPEVYKSISSKPDELFVVGSIKNLNDYIILDK